jgi:hypothetical protein
MLPLIRRDAETRLVADYQTLNQALDAGLLEITEVSEQGSVPELRAVNRGLTPTLIVDGEELVGAKQNRVVNLTILVPAAAALTIPVTCVEVGRWQARSKGFAAAPRAQYSTGRAKRMAQVTKSMKRGARTSDQSQVWADIAEKSAHLGANSPTGAMSAMFERHGDVVDECVNRLQPIDGQVGALFAVNDAIVGLDLFDCDETLATLLPKLVRSVVIDALDRTGVGVVGRVADSEKAIVAFSPESFLVAVNQAQCRVREGVGLGVDFRLTAPNITGAALVLGDRVVHLSAFAIGT